MSLPKRHFTHVYQERSRTFFLGCLPDEWTRQEFHPDYGKDFQIGIVIDGQITNLNFIVQLKSSAEPFGNEDFETIRLSMAQYNHLNDDLYVAMLVKYIVSEDEAYWELLYKVVPPENDQKGFTVRIPRSNRLSEIDWDIVQKHVTKVTARKLGFPK